MSKFRLARLSLMLAAVGLNAAPVLMSSAHAQKSMPLEATSAQGKPGAAPVAAKPDTVRPDLFKLLDPAMVKQLMADKNYAEVQAKITQAEAFPDRTPYENYVIDRMKLSLAASTNNDKMAIAALESVINSGRLTGAEQHDFIQALANYHYNAKDYDNAIKWMQRYEKESATPLKVRNSLIRAHYLKGDYASAKTALLPVIAEAEKAGKAPEAEDLRLLASSAAKVKDNATYIGALEKLVKFYPSDDFWTDLVNRVAAKPGYQARLDIEIFRLKNATVKAMAPEEYVEFAELTLNAGFPTEAKKALDAGYAAGVLGTGSNAAKHKQLRDKATKGAADDAKNIAAGEASANKSKDGAGLVNLGYAYVTMDQLDKGIALIEKGIAKGGMKNPDDYKLRLGIAYAKAGRKDDATKVFESIKGNDGTAELAKYWAMWMNGPAAGAAAVAAAPVAAK